MTLKTERWDATVELDKKISLFLSQISQKYGVRITMDSSYDKGIIRINVKDKPE